MNRSTGAVILTMQDLADMYDSNSESPVIDRMIFIDVRETSKSPRRQFPCYICDVDKVHNKFKVALIQWVSGSPQVVIVSIGEDAIQKDKKVQFWDKAPTRDLLIMHPISKDGKKKWKKAGDTFEEVTE